MKKIIKKMKKNNSGFSLLEILLAVILLAIVVTPLIQTVYSSMSLNKKARIMMGANDVGQSIVEHYEAMTYDGNITSNDFWWPAQSNGYYYDGHITISHLFDGSNYQLYEVKVDVYYKPNNDPLKRTLMATYKGSMYSKLED